MGKIQKEELMEECEDGSFKYKNLSDDEKIKAVRKFTKNIEQVIFLLEEKNS